MPNIRSTRSYTETMRTSILLNALTASIAGLLLLGVPAAHADAPPAQLSVTLKNSEKTVTTGDKVTYTGKVANLGDNGADLKVVLQAPAYVKLTKAGGAKVEKNEATWTTTIAPGKTASFTAEASIGSIPRNERRVTTLASVYVGGGAAPIVRTANASFIAGVADTPGGKATHTPVASSSGSASAATWAWLVGAAVLVILVIAAVILLIRGRRAGGRRRAASNQST